MNSCPRTSPRFIDGMKPLYRCRSEPQTAVLVIRTIASREFRIFGSGTSSTCTDFVPCQVFALITPPPQDSRVRSKAAAARVVTVLGHRTGEFLRSRHAV